MQIFGLQLNKKKKEEKENPLSVVAPNSDDGSTVVTTNSSAMNHFGYVLDMDSIIKNENDLIRRYREIAQYSDCDAAINDIVNEAIVTDDEKLIEIKLDDLKVSDSIKNIITNEFEEVLKLFDFDEFGPDIFRQWYIDGRIYYQALIDPANIKNGITELRKVDPRKIRKIKNVIKQRNDKGVEVVVKTDEYYLYNDKGISEQTTQGVKLSLDSIIYCPSGLIDPNSGMTLGHLHKAVKPTNQLKMIEDSLVIYRISRAPERRIFYIDVGNLPKVKAEQYVNDIMNKFRNKIVYDASTGEVRNDRKHLCLDMNTKVPLLDGRTLTLSEIEKEYKEKQLWAYSCDPITGKFVPGLITWAGVSNPNAQVLRITLDNGESITCTPEHKFPVWNKGFVQAQDLTIGESMIPLYRRTSNITTGKSKDYEQVFDNETKSWVFTHREVSNWKDEHNIDNEFVFSERYAEAEKKTVHHKNINRFDNSPENLIRMNSKDHIVYHRDSSSNSGKIGGKRCYEMQVGIHNKNHPDYAEWHKKAGLIGGRIVADLGISAENFAKGRKVLAELITNEEWNSEFRAAQRAGWTDDKKAVASNHAKRNELSKRGNQALSELWKDEDYSKQRAAKYKTEYTDEIKVVFEKCIRANISHSNTLKVLNEYVSFDDWKYLNVSKVGTQKDFSKIVKEDLTRLSNLFGFETFKQARESIEFRNHKIVNIEWLEERIDTGCLTIDGDEIYHNHHTFALDAGIYTQNSMLEDFWMPRREGGKGTEITTLPGGQTLGQIDDIQYFQNKLFQALNVPLGRLQPQQGFSLGRSTEITREEVKFNRFIGRLRKKFSNLLLDALRIQLVAKGIIREDEWVDIKQYIQFDYQHDNYFAELKDNEILMERLGTLQQIDQYVGRYFSVEWVQKNVLKQSEQDIEEIIAQNQENPPYPPEEMGQEQPQQGKQ